MRIGILTLPLHTNYGGILQAYALQTVLERMGHDVVVFDTPNKAYLPPLWKLPLSMTKRVLLKGLGKGDRIFIEHHLNKTRPVIAQNIQPFIDKYIHRKVIRKFTDLKSQDFDAIVVGSDQVWRAIYFPMWGEKQDIENAYLSFTEGWNIKRISYAASFGTDDWEYTNEQTLRCKALLQMFDAISVRETNGINLCKKYFDVDSVHVLDPTLLLDEFDYSMFFQNANTPKSDGTLLNYILDETEESTIIISDVAKQKCLETFSVNNPYEYDESKPLSERIKPSVEKWLRGFYDAEFVVTDSFHACVFSILFKKQFVVIGNETRGMSRIESLLKMFEIEDRLVTSIFNVKTLPNIDYDNVYSLLINMRKNSINYLQEALS